MLQGKTQAAKSNAALLDKLEAASGGDGGHKNKGNGSQDRRGSADAATPAAVAVPGGTAAIPRNVSFDGSKVRMDLTLCV